MKTDKEKFKEVLEDLTNSKDEIVALAVAVRQSSIDNDFKLTSIGRDHVALVGLAVHLLVGVGKELVQDGMSRSEVVAQLTGKVNECLTIWGATK
jgi:hypothetical protein